FAQLSKSAARYGASYVEVTDQITEKLTGQKIETRLGSVPDDDSPGWAKWAMGLFSLAAGNFAGAALAASGFDFKSILLNFFTTAGVSIVASAVFGAMLGPIGFVLIGLGVGALQADHARKQFAKAIKTELVKQLPQVVQEQWQPIYSAVQECFDAYEREVVKRINDDIQARKAELDNLLKQKESREIDRGIELSRLNGVESSVSTECQGLEAEYQALLH
ncbi:MAG TPA: dynamin, partial [Thermosynechococcaceae cyanobacterium]